MIIINDTYIYDIGDIRAVCKNDGSALAIAVIIHRSREKEGEYKGEEKVMLNNKKRKTIGIDPDCEQSGVAIVDLADKTIHVYKYDFPTLLDYLHGIVANGEDDIVVVVEAGYLRKSNWHINPRLTSAYKAAALGNAVGRNHETARKILEMCRYWNISVKEVTPLTKIWKGVDGKITHDELKAICEYNGFTGLQNRTNQDQRDSCLLAFMNCGIRLRFKR